MWQHCIMIISSSLENYSTVWDAVEEEFGLSSEKGVTIIFSVHEVETVCSVKMMQVCTWVAGCVMQA